MRCSSTVAIYIHCPHCHERLEAKEQCCTHCGEELPPGVLLALAAARGESPTPSPMMPPRHRPTHLTQFSSTTAPQQPAEPLSPGSRSALRPWLAAALSLICGLGQLYNGQVIKGIVLMVLGTAAIVSIQLPSGKIMLPLLWIYAIVDAYIVARRTGR